MMSLNFSSAPIHNSIKSKVEQNRAGCVYEFIRHWFGTNFPELMKSDYHYTYMFLFVSKSEGLQSK